MEPLQTLAFTHLENSVTMLTMYSIQSGHLPLWGNSAMSMKPPFPGVGGVMLPDHLPSWVSDAMSM